jgi:monoamine oxidase
MNQRGVILAVVAVGLVSAALWYWYGSAEQPAAPAKDTASLQGAFHGSATGPDPWPAPSSQTAVSADAAPAPAPELAPPPAAAPAEPPQSVDTPEPAQRKFARGGKADEPQQN